MSGEMPSHRIEQTGLNGARSSCLQRNRWNAALVGLTFLVAAIPILWVTFPPVMDLPNHLARIWLAAGAVNMPPLSAMYEIDWAQASTNVLVDFVAATLARVLPIFFLAKVILLLMFLGPPLCGCLLNRAIFGASSTW
jgi:hypothetical protein